MIRELESSGHQVVVASSGESSVWLGKELDKEIRELPDYSIRYAIHSTWWSVLRQLPQLWRVIRQENRILESWTKQEDFELVLSDNRYGCYSKEIPSIFLSHQLIIPTPYLRRPIARMHARFIGRFNRCWILDDKELRLAGIMSDPKYLKIPYEYIGFPPDQIRWNQEGKSIGLILSGPEPQRSILEQELLKLDWLRQRKVILVRGTDLGNEPDLPDQWEVHGICDRKELADIIQRTEMIIGRSGYSSIWNYLHSGIKAILIPTPGQFEQEYLARRMTDRKLLACILQNELDKLFDIKPIHSNTGSDLKLPGLGGLFETEAES